MKTEEQIREQIKKNVDTMNLGDLVAQETYQNLRNENLVLLWVLGE